jgi:hypothetical protein
VYVIANLALFYSFDVFAITNQRDLVFEEILRRYSYTDEACRDTLLGNTLRFYEFPEETINKMLDEAKARFENIHNGNPDYGK